MNFIILFSPQRYTHFVQNSGLRDEVCVVIANKFTTEDGVSNNKGDKLGKAFIDSFLYINYLFNSISRCFSKSIC